MLFPWSWTTFHHNLVESGGMSGLVGGQLTYCHLSDDNKKTIYTGCLYRSVTRNQPLSNNLGTNQHMCGLNKILIYWYCFLWPLMTKVKYMSRLVSLQLPGDLIVWANVWSCRDYKRLQVLCAVNVLMIVISQRVRHILDIPHSFLSDSELFQMTSG